MKLNQAVERNGNSGPRKSNYLGVDSDKIKSNIYGVDQSNYNEKPKSYSFKNHNNQKDVNRGMRNSRASTTYGSGSNRTNTSTGLRRNKNYTMSDSKNPELRRIANSHLERSETQDGSLKNNKNIINEMYGRRKSCEKKTSDREFIKNIVKNNSKWIKSKYGENQNLEVSRMGPKLPSTQTWTDFNRNIRSPDKTNLVNNVLLHNQKISASTSKLQNENNIRREENFPKSYTGEHKSNKLEGGQKDFNSTFGGARSSFLNRINQDPKTPELGSKIEETPIK